MNFLFLAVQAACVILHVFLRIHCLSVCQPIQKGVVNLLKYTLRKLLALIPKLLVIMIMCFTFMELLPGDALSRTMNPEQYHELSAAQKEE